MRQLSIAEVEYVVHALAKQIIAWNELIPDFSTRFPHILESCLAVPFQSFSGRTKYKSLTARAAALFYFLIKNHPFQNGNKRVAVVCLLYFLHKNEKWLYVDNMELYNFSRWVAESNVRVKDETILAIEKFLKTYIKDLTPHQMSEANSGAGQA